MTSLFEHSVSDCFIAHAEMAVARLGYLYSGDWKFDRDRAVITYQPSVSEAVDSAKLKSEVQFQLYRAKIFSDTLAIRKQLYAGVGCRP